jgi:hypothetical protein
MAMSSTIWRALSTRSASSPILTRRLRSQARVVSEKRTSRAFCKRARAAAPIRGRLLSAASFVTAVTPSRVTEQFSTPPSSYDAGLMFQPCLTLKQQFSVCGWENFQAGRLEPFRGALFRETSASCAI